MVNKYYYYPKQNQEPNKNDSRNRAISTPQNHKSHNQNLQKKPQSPVKNSPYTSRFNKNTYSPKKINYDPQKIQISPQTQIQKSDNAKNTPQPQQQQNQNNQKQYPQNNINKENKKPQQINKVQLPELPTILTTSQLQQSSPKGTQQKQIQKKIQEIPQEKLKNQNNNNMNQQNISKKRYLMNPRFAYTPPRTPRLIQGKRPYSPQNNSKKYIPQNPIKKPLQITKNTEKINKMEIIQEKQEEKEPTKPKNNIVEYQTQTTLNTVVSNNTNYSEKSNLSDSKRIFSPKRTLLNKEKNSLNPKQSPNNQIKSFKYPKQNTKNNKIQELDNEHEQSQDQINSVSNGIESKQQSKQFIPEIQSLISNYENIQSIQRYLKFYDKQLSQLLKEYITNIGKKVIDEMIDVNFQGFFQKEEKNRKLIKQAQILERLTISTLIILYLDKNHWQQHFTSIKNIIIYILSNIIILLDYLHTKFSDQLDQSQHIQCQKLIHKHQQQPNQDILNNTNKRKNLSQMKQNNDIVLNLLKNSCKNSKEYFNFFLNFVKHQEKYTLKENYMIQFEFLAKYLTNFENNNGYIGLPFLTIVPEPFLPPLSKKSIKTDNNNNGQNIEKNDKNEKEFTLILDLDETLIHYQSDLNPQNNKLNVRPYMHSFLKDMSQYYEIVIFTAAMEDYATWVLENMGVGYTIDYALFRQHTFRNETQLIKDISKLGRDIKKCIIVDNTPENFQLQPENGIFIKPWYNDPNDQALMHLGPLLKKIVSKNVGDVRQVLKKFKEQMIENIKKGVENPHLHLNI